MGVDLFLNRSIPLPYDFECKRKIPHSIAQRSKTSDTDLPHDKSSARLAPLRTARKSSFREIGVGGSESTHRTSRSKIKALRSSEAGE